MEDAPPFTQEPVLETSDPHQGVRKTGSGSQAVKNNPRALEGEGDEGMLKGWDITKCLFLGYTRNGLNNLLRLAML